MPNELALQTVQVNDSTPTINPDEMPTRKIVMKRFAATSRRRRVVRRALRARCQAVGMEDFKVFGERILDISPYGMMVAADAEVSAGDDVLVSFQLPGDGRWYDAEAKVARVIEGWRPFDPGYAVGLKFTNIDLDDRLSLRKRLRGIAPPVPTRKLRTL